MKYVVIGILALLLLAYFNVFYTVDETEQVLIFQFGKYVKTVTNAGLKMKLPSPIQEVERFDKRVLEYDASPTEIVTEDKKNLLVDNYARWKISEPLLFYQSVRSEIGAQSRLDDIIYAKIRELFGKHRLSEIISEMRDSIMTIVSTQCKEEAAQYGINILDVRVKRADLPKQNEEAVFLRMIQERARIAKQYRSEGEEEALKIRSIAEAKRARLLAEAEREANIIRGQADSIAAKTYADAYTEDEEFYHLWKSLSTYKKVFKKNTTVVLPADSDFLKYLKE